MSVIEEFTASATRFMGRLVVAAGIGWVAMTLGGADVVAAVVVGLIALGLSKVFFPYPSTLSQPFIHYTLLLFGLVGWVTAGYGIWYYLL